MAAFEAQTLQNRTEGVGCHYTARPKADSSTGLETTSVYGSLAVSSKNLPGMPQDASDPLLSAYVAASTSKSSGGAKNVTRRRVNPGERVCLLPGCDQVFTPKDNGNTQRWCCYEHKKECYHMATMLGMRQIERAFSGSQTSRALKLLDDGRWKSRPAEPVFRDAVRKLRDRGYKIDYRTSRSGQTGLVEHQYRLVAKPPQKETGNGR